MAKKVLTKRMVETGDFWEEIDDSTKKKILEKVRKEMSKDLKKSRNTKSNSKVLGVKDSNQNTKKQLRMGNKSMRPKSS